MPVDIVSLSGYGTKGWWIAPENYFKLLPTIVREVHTLLPGFRVRLHVTNESMARPKLAELANAADEVVVVDLLEAGVPNPMNIFFLCSTRTSASSSPETWTAISSPGTRRRSKSG